MSVRYTRRHEPVALIDASVAHIQRHGFDAGTFHGERCCFIGTLNRVSLPWYKRWNIAIMSPQQDRYSCPAVRAVLDQLDTIACSRGLGDRTTATVVLGKDSELLARFLDPQGAVDVLLEARAEFTWMDVMNASPPAPEPEPIDRTAIWS